MFAKYFGLALILLANCSFANSPDGNFDTAWGHAGSIVQRQYAGGFSGATDYYAAAIQPDGQLIVAGGCSDPFDPRATYDACFTRMFGSDGTLDHGFGPLSTGQARVGDISPSLAGSPPLGGSRHYLSVDAQGNIAAFLLFYALRVTPNASGAVSSLLRTAECTDVLGIYAGSVSRSGKLIGVGKTPGQESVGVSRLNADASYDTNFNSTSACGGLDVGNSMASNNLPHANAVAVQTIQGDDKILVAGYSDTGSGMQATVIRINGNGTIDASFGSAGVTRFHFYAASNDDVLNAIAVDVQGNIVVGGYHQVAGLDHDFLIARLLANGTLDSTFGNPVGAGTSHSGMTTVAFDLGKAGYGNNSPNTDEANDLLIQPDGKILLGGSSAYDNLGHSRLALTRLSRDGVMDTSFAAASPLGAGKLGGTYPAGAGLDDSIDAILLAPGDRTYIVGHSLDGSGARAFGVARLTLDSLDPVFKGNFD